MNPGAQDIGAKAPTATKGFSATATAPRSRLQQQGGASGTGECSKAEGQRAQHSAVVQGQPVGSPRREIGMWGSRKILQFIYFYLCPAKMPIVAQALAAAAILSVTLAYSPSGDPPRS